jgi:CBS domain-containing protein
VPPASPTGDPLGVLLTQQWPTYLAFVTSFATIPIMWVNHHRMVVHLGGIARLRHIGRRSSATFDDGWRTWGPRSNISSERRCRILALISMAAVLGGTMRSPFTSIVFAFELTHDGNVFLPLLVGSVIAHTFRVLTLKRSILTEKVARRGYHLSREYAVDPLEILFVREVMRTKVVVLSSTSTLGELQQLLRTDHHQNQRLLPVVNPEGQFVGVLTRGDISTRIEAEGEAVLQRSLAELVRREHVEAYPDEPLRAVVYRMAEKGITRMSVVEQGTKRFLGLVSLEDLLKARGRNLDEERRRERTLKLCFLSSVTSNFKKTAS